MRALTLIFACAALTISRVRAEMASQPLEVVTSESELIVVAKVTAVSTRPDKIYATAQVLQTWKGTSGPTVEFLAEPWWACDISEAHAGETAVLFLVRGEQSRSFLLDAAGGGRMPVRIASDIEFASASCYVILPDAVESTPETKDTECPRLVRLDKLREAVRRVLLALSVPKA